MVWESDIETTVVTVAVADEVVTNDEEFEFAGMPQMLRAAAEEVERLEAQNAELSYARAKYGPGGPMLHLYFHSIPPDHPLSRSESSRADSR